MQKEELNIKIKKSICKTIVIPICIFLCIVLIYLLVPSVSRETLNTFEDKGLYKIEKLEIECNITEKYIEYRRRRNSLVEKPYYCINLYTEDDGGTKHKEAEFKETISKELYDTLERQDTVIVQTQIYYSYFGARLFKGKTIIEEKTS